MASDGVRLALISVISLKNQEMWKNSIFFDGISTCGLGGRNFENCAQVVILLWKLKLSLFKFCNYNYSIGLNIVESKKGNVMTAHCFAIKTWFCLNIQSITIGHHAKSLSSSLLVAALGFITINWMMKWNETNDLLLTIDVEPRPAPFSLLTLFSWLVLHASYQVSHTSWLTFGGTLIEEKCWKRLQQRQYLKE